MANKLFKQHNIRGIGPFIDVLYLTTPLFGVVSYAMVAGTMYAVIREYILWVFPWMRLQYFFVVLFFLAILALLIVFKFIYPSYYRFKNRQEYEHGNLIRKDLRRHARNQKKIMEHLGLEYEEEEPE